MNIHDLEAIVRDRQANPQTGSYTNKLLEAGLPRIAQKVGEEGVEVVIAALTQSDDELIGEMVDWLYHATVMLAERGITWQQVEALMADRHATKSEDTP